MTGETETVCCSHISEVLQVEDLFAKGGWVSILIFFVTFVNLALFIRVRTHLPSIKRRILYRLQNRTENGFGENSNETLRLYLRDPEVFFTKEFFEPETMTAWIRNLAGIATMLGLLGTVIGIAVAFEEMKHAGTVSLEIFSEGIRLALNTTIQGLCAAIPSLLAFQYLRIYIHKTELEIKTSVEYEIPSFPNSDIRE